MLTGALPREARVEVSEMRESHADVPGPRVLGCEGLSVIDMGWRQPLQLSML